MADRNTQLYLRLAGYAKLPLVSLESILCAPMPALLDGISFMCTRDQLILPLFESILPGTDTMSPILGWHARHRIDLDFRWAFTCIWRFYANTSDVYASSLALIQQL